MAIREDLVASAVQFLQDPSVAASTIDNRIAFLRTKNLTQEEIDAALARTGAQPAAAQYPVSANTAAAPQQQYYQPNPSQYAWQPSPPVPKRDWRDWFIMATVVGGVSYGLFTLGKRYVFPLIAPPTPERLEQDKKTIEEQFDKAFSLVEQLAKDTEALKAAEQERTERLDTALSDLEAVINDLKSSNRRREDEAQRIKDDVVGLKDAIPKALNAQKDLADTRLREVNAELTSLKTLITQRMNNTSASSGTNGYLRPSSGNATPSSPATAKSGLSGDENSAGDSVVSPGGEAAKSGGQAGFGRTLGSSPFGGSNSGTKASIPAWQMAMANKGSGSTANGADAGGSSQNEATSS